MMQRVRYVACAVWITLAPAIASAQRTPPASDTTAAAAAYERGLAALRANRYGDAALELETSYRANPVPAVLFNLALAYRGSGRLVAAVETFERYLRDAGTSVASERREAIDRAMGELRARLGVVDCEITPSTATFVIDGRAHACTPRTYVDPGEHVLEARAQAHADERQPARIDAGQTLRFHVRLLPIAIATPTAPPTVVPPPSVTAPTVPTASPIYTRWWFWTAIGVAVAGGAVLAYGLTRSPETPSLGTTVNVEAARAW